MKGTTLNKLEAVKKRLIEGMTDHIADGDDCYTKADIKKCDKILRQFVTSLHRLDASAPELVVLDCVKQAVLKLNALNNSVEGCLIETDQREDLCEYLLLAVRDAGLSHEGDVTEEWREW